MTDQTQFSTSVSSAVERLAETRRYLVNIDSVSMSQLFTDCLVIGAGIAGLRAAIEAADKRKIIIVCKGNIQDSNTYYAQGGIASVLDKGDSFELHVNDTLNTGCGISDREIVEIVIRQGPQLIEQLLRWGADFDLIDGHIATTIEGGHSHHRIAHAHGDETGRIVAESLIKKVRQNQNIRVIENFFAIDLLTTEDNKCVGIIGYDKQRGLLIIWSANTIMATGGAGQLYRETTNPEIATGDGLAMAYRAGAVLRDMEFMQFHPTTLYVAGASRTLITEALRGEGAVLLDSKGCRFMKEYHQACELAPRDIVSRAILSQMLKTSSTHVYLDVRHIDKTYFAKRFPLINELCESFNIDVSRDLIPVRPSAHYMIGGVKTDARAVTGIENLYACGEVASTGLHGANRLGSNSLLEGLVLGKTAGQSVLEHKKAGVSHIKHPLIRYQITHSKRSRLDLPLRLATQVGAAGPHGAASLDTIDVRNSLRSLMWRNVGINRAAQPLADAQETIRFWQRYVMDKIFDEPSGWECQNMLTTCLLMARAAQLRQESRGVHFRFDFPKTDDEHFKKHIEIARTK